MRKNIVTRVITGFAVLSLSLTSLFNVANANALVVPTTMPSQADIASLSMVYAVVKDGKVVLKIGTYEFSTGMQYADYLKLVAAGKCPALPASITTALPLSCEAVIKAAAPFVMNGIDTVKAIILFDAQMTQATVTLKASTTKTQAVNDFVTSYRATNAGIVQSAVDATKMFDVTTINKGDEPRNYFVDKFNNAKSNYFNSLDQAKNRLAGELSGNSDVAKDTFMNSFNASRDSFGNKLETIKNDVIAKL